jgi:hypothetical protein
MSGRSLKSFRACWLKSSLLSKRCYKWQFNTQYTCPHSETRKFPMGMSAYKLVAIMNHDANAPEVNIAFGEPFPTSAISFEALLTFQQTTSWKHQNGKGPCGTSQSWA